MEVKLRFIKCMFKMHERGREVQCPFTGMTYIHCSKCDKIFKVRVS